MKVIAFISRQRILAELSPDDLAGLAGVTGAYWLGEAFSEDEYISGKGFQPGIVGKTLDVSHVFQKAKEALDSQKEAVEAAKKLERTAKTFLQFFTKT